MSHKAVSRRRLIFVCLVAACWILGLFGLDRSRISSFQLPLVAVVCLLAYALVAAIRRRMEDARERAVPGTGGPPATCVVVRQFGRSGGVPVGSKPQAPVPIIVPMHVIPTRHEAPAQPARPRPQRPSRKPRLDYIPLSGT